MSDQLQQALVDIGIRLTRIETHLERAAEDRLAIRELELRVGKLESFQGKIIGAVLAAGSLGGVAGALLPMLLSP